MSNGIYQDAITQSTSVQVGEDGVELSMELNKATPAAAEPQAASAEPTAEEEDKLQQRLRALRA